MSWDVLIVKTDGKTPIQDMSKDYKSEPLGDAEELRAELSQCVDGLDWSDPAWGLFMGDGFSLEFDFTEDGPVDTFMLHVRGGGDAVSTIVAMCKHFGWQALDCSTGEFIDLDDPSTEGWEGFQKFRDKMIREYPDSEGGGTR